jgi:hypothetical protein
MGGGGGECGSHYRIRSAVITEFKGPLPNAVIQANSGAQLRGMVLHLAQPFMHPSGRVLRALAVPSPPGPLSPKRGEGEKESKRSLSLGIKRFPLVPCAGRASGTLFNAR